MNRTKAVSKIKEYLLKRDWPRFQMSLILIFTALFGFLCSFVMLRMGCRTLWLRYCVAATAGYLVFLVLIRFWLAYQQRFISFDVDPSDLLNIMGSDRPTSGSSYRQSVIDGIDVPSGEDLFQAFDLEGLAFAIVVLVLICGLSAFCLYIVASAPMLFAELLLDAFVMGAFARGLKMSGAGNPHWLRGVVRRTIVPFLGTACLLIVLGAAIQKHDPNADSIGDVFAHRQKVNDKG